MILLLSVLPIILLVLSRKKDNIFFTLLFVLFMILMGGLRSTDMRNDGYNYETWFDYGAEWLYERVEFSYAWINDIIISADLGFQWVLLVLSFITVSFMYLAAKRGSPNRVMLALTFYFLLTYYFYSYNAVRQMTAVSIVIYAFTFLKEKKFVYFVSLILFASTFHNTALFALVALIVIPDKITFSNKFVVTTILFSLIFGGFNLTINLLDRVAYLLPRYIEEGGGNYVRESSLSLSRVAMSVFFCFFYTHYNNKDLYLKIAYIGVLLFNLCAFSTVMMRIAYFFLPIQMFLYANISPLNAKNIKSKDLHSLSLIYSMAIYYYMVVFNNLSDVLYYKLGSLW